MKVISLTISTFIGFLFLSSPSFSQNPTLQWAKALYSSQTSFTSLYADAVEIDSQGNMYVIGSFQGTLDLDPGTDEVKITSKEVGFGKSESFMAKYNSNGDFIYGFKLDAYAEELAIASNNDVYLIGSFDTIVDFDPGEAIHTLDGTKNNTFIARYNKDGQYQSAFSIGQGAFSDVRSVGLDSKNNLCIYGTFRDTVDFDPSSKVKNLVSSNSNSILYLAKYSDKNELQFAFSINNPQTNWHSCLDFDTEDNIFINGNYLTRSGDQLPLDLDPGPNNTNLKGIAGVDGFWAKYSPEGAYMAGFLYDGGTPHLFIDNSNNIYLSGSTADGMDVDLGSGEHKLYTDPGGFDQFLVKYNASFDLIYGMTFRGNSREMRIEEMRVDDHQNVYLCGDFQDTIGFVKASAQGDVIAKGARDAFMAKFDNTGQFKYAQSFGTENAEAAKHLNIDNKGNVWLTGSFTSAINLDPADDQDSLLNSAGGGAMFLSQFLDPLALSVKQQEEQTENITIYPTNGHLVVEFTNQNVINATIKITGINGQIYRNFAHVKNRTLHIAVSELPQNQVFVV